MEDERKNVKATLNVNLTAKRGIKLTAFLFLLRKINKRMDRVNMLIEKARLLQTDLASEGFTLSLK